MAKESSTIIGMDVGGTRIKIGLVDSRGGVLFLKHYPTSVEMGQEKVLKRMAEIIKSFIHSSTQGKKAPQVIGLGVPGIIGRNEGILYFSANFPGWKDVPLAQFIAEETGLTTFMENDANVITYGEKWFGAGQDLNTFVCLTLGTGVGSGLILNGQPWYGSQGTGPEIGHITIQPYGERCHCGSRGCLETLASEPYLVKKAQRSLNKKIPTLLTGMLSRDGRNLTAKVLFEAARKGDPLCLSIYANMGKYLGIALATLVYTVGVEGIVLGGGVSQAANIFLPYLKKEFKKRLTMISSEEIVIRISTLGEKAGILGAAKMAMDRNIR
jgi:glucokinase